jgi:hypothetical protein
MQASAQSTQTAGTSSYRLGQGEGWTWRYWAARGTCWNVGRKPAPQNPRLPTGLACQDLALPGRRHAA